jgi:hypothetical protein
MKDCQVTASELAEALRAVLEDCSTLNCEIGESLLARYDARRPDKCEVCGSENCSELWKDQRKCCPDCTCKPVPSEVERLSIVVVRANEKVIRSRHGSSTRNWNRVERDKAIGALRDALRNRGAI